MPPESIKDIKDHASKPLDSMNLKSSLAHGNPSFKSIAQINGVSKFLKIAKAIKNR